MKAGSVGNNQERGSSTLELVIALAILTVTMSAIILVVFSNQTLSADVRVRQEAIARATATLTKARSSANQDFLGVISSISANDIYTTNLDVTDLTPCRKRIVGRVEWAIDPLRPGSAELATDVTNISEARALGDDCPTREPTGDWSSLHIIGSTPAGLAARTIDVQNGIAFLAASGSFSIIDSRARQHPITTATIALTNNLNAIDVADHYVYGASNASSGQLQVIDVSDVYHPTIVASVSLPNVGGSHPEATAVFYYDFKVYVGTPRLTGTNAHEFHVYDVSDPPHPTYVSGPDGVEVDHNINSINVRNGVAYVGISTNQGAQKDLLIYDVTAPNHITPISFIDLPGGGVRSLDIIGNRLYLGCFAVAGKEDFFIVDITHPITPTILGSVRIGADVTAVKVSDGKAFLATSDSKAELQIWSVLDPSNMARLAKYDGPKGATGLDYEDSAIWGSFTTGNPLQIISSAP